MIVLIASVNQLVENPAEQAVFIGTEAVGSECVHDFLDDRIAIVTLARVIAAVVLHRQNLLGSQSEDVDVLQADCLGNLDVGAVPGADS